MKKITVLILSLLMATGLMARTVFADSISDAGQRSSAYLVSQRDSSGSIGGVGFSGWALQGIAANGQSSSSTLTYLANNVGSISSATDIERTILAVTAARQNPRNFGGVDLVDRLKSLANSGQIGSTGLVNDDIFGILALLSAGESPNDPVLTNSVQFLANSQFSDGSFGSSRTGGGDSNNTAVAIQALLIAQRNGISSSANISAATAYLRSAQNADGGFGFFPGVTSDGSSTSWTINAIIALGQNPESWTVNSNNPYTFLQSLQTESGGVKSQPSSTEPDLFTSSFAAIAFARKVLPVAIIKAEPSPSPVPSLTPSPVPSPTPSPSIVPSPSPSPSPLPSFSPTPTPSPSPSPHLSPSPQTSLSPTPSPSPSPSSTNSPTPSPVSSPTPSSTPSLTPSPVISPTPQPTLSPSPIVSASPKISPTPFLTPTPRLSPSPSPSSTLKPSPSISLSPSFSPGPTQSPTPKPSLIPTPSSTILQSSVGNPNVSGPTILPASSAVSPQTDRPVQLANIAPQVATIAQSSEVSPGTDPVDPISPDTSLTPAASPSSTPSLTPSPSSSPDILGTAMDKTRSPYLLASLMVFAGVILGGWGTATILSDRARKRKL